MIKDLLVRQADSFSEPLETRAEIEALCGAMGDAARFISLGISEEGREIHGVILGRGSRKASLIGGSHGDEPLGPEALRRFIIAGIEEKEKIEDLLEEWTLYIIPQVNPDGEERNASWIRRWPSLKDYLQLARREPPGRDIEFGYPDMREENRLLTRFWSNHSPFRLHISFHGMGYSEGALLLVERHWIDRTGAVRKAFTRSAEENGLMLHDHNRKGEKGFYYIGPGFSTTPEGKMMRFHFESSGDSETASQFRSSSMEWIRSLGGDPLCLVTELPLFVIEGEAEREPGVPVLYNRFREAQEDILESFSRGKKTVSLPEGLRIRPLPVGMGVGMLLGVLESALEAAR